MRAKKLPPSHKSIIKRPAKALAGSQTLTRGLDILEAVAEGVDSLNALSEALGLNRSTAHRLASSLVERKYLNFAPRIGYSLGSKLLELGHQARDQMSLPRVARPHIEGLAIATGDTVHLGVLDGHRALYLDKIPGSRRIEICSRVGERHPLRSTGLGKSLILDESSSRLKEYYLYESNEGRPYGVSLNSWLRRMTEYAKLGYSLDLEENEDRIRCVAAPIRDVTNKIVGAISVSSAAQYMDDSRMKSLAEDVRSVALEISKELGWSGDDRSNRTAKH